MIQLRKKTGTATSITLEWDPVPGAIGYRFQSAASSIWSHTFDSTRTSVKFSKAAWYKVEALGVKDVGLYPTTPQPGVASKHVSSHHQRDYLPAVYHYDRGDYVFVGEWAARQAAADLSIPVFAYSSAVSARDGFFTGLTPAEALAGGHALKDSNGRVLQNAAYQPSVLCDPGRAGYRQAWLNKVIGQIRDHDGAQGVFIDDVVMSTHIADGTPALYPTQPSWRAAMELFISNVGPALKAAGLLVMTNAGAWYPGSPNFDNGQGSVDWGQTMAKWSTHVMIENGFQTVDGSNVIRRMGPEWFNNWDGWAKVITAIESAGANYVGMADAPAGDSPEAIYLKASMLLWMNRPGSSCMFRCEDAGGSPFGPLVSTDLGKPLIAAVLTGQTWSRDFELGRVQVNPWARTASITVT